LRTRPCITVRET
nr:immunoglobulin heavy chain junction region [Homo sapiens]